MSQVQSIPQNGAISAKPKSTRIIAEVISYVFHPVFFPLLMAIAVFKLVPGDFWGITEYKYKLWFLNIGITCVFFPLFSVALMKPLGFISSFKMETARERTIPLMAIMIFYFWVSHVFNTMDNRPPLIPPPFVFKVLLLGNFWGVILMFIANIFTKVSLHTATAGGMIGIILVLMIMKHPIPADQSVLLVALMVAIVLAAIIGAARLALGSHQRGDVLLGYIIGILVQLGAYVYMK